MGGFETLYNTMEPVAAGATHRVAPAVAHDGGEIVRFSRICPPQVGPSLHVWRRPSSWPRSAPDPKVSALLPAARTLALRFGCRLDVDQPAVHEHVLVGHDVSHGVFRILVRRRAEALRYGVMKPVLSL